MPSICPVAPCCPVLLADRQGENVLSNSKWQSRISSARGLSGLKSMLFDEEKNRQALQEL